MTMSPINGISAMRVSANYGKSVPPVRQPKKVDFSDAMVVPVEEAQKPKEQANVRPVQEQQTAKAIEASKEFNRIANTMADRTSFYNASLQGGSYGVVGGTIDVMA